MSKILAHFTDYGHRPERRKLNTFGALGYYRMYKPSQCLTNHKIDLRGVDIDNYGDSFEENWENIFKKYDAYWAVHFFGEREQAAQAYLADKYKKILIYDLDDNFMDLPKSNPAYEKFKKITEVNQVDTARQRATMSASLSFADAITVSTEPLKERLAAHMKRTYGMEKKIYVIPNMNDIKDWQFSPSSKDKKKVIIGYTGSNSHQDDLLLVLPVLQRLMKRYSYVNVEILGAIDKSKLDIYFKGWESKLLERVSMVPATATFWEYPEWLSKQRWDIGLAPLVDNPFTICKSHIKWLEYSMFQIPCVASRVYPYYMNLQGRKTIQDGVTGLLCRPNEWEKNIEKLILDKPLRERLGRQAFDAIEKNWQYKDSQIQETFERLLVECKKD